MGTARGSTQGSWRPFASRVTASPAWKPLSPRQREARLTALYAATDVYLWKLLRRDLKHDRSDTEQAFRQLVHGVLVAVPVSDSRKRG